MYFRQCKTSCDTHSKMASNSATNTTKMAAEKKNLNYIPGSASGVIMVTQYWTSHQWFPTKSVCTIDGFRHWPCLQRRDNVHVKEPAILNCISETHLCRNINGWMKSDNKGTPIETYAHTQWYATMTECMEASKNVSFEQTGETDFEFVFEVNCASRVVNTSDVNSNRI